MPFISLYSQPIIAFCAPFNYVNSADNFIFQSQTITILRVDQKNTRENENAFILIHFFFRLFAMCPTAFLRINREHQQIEVRKWANAIFDWIAFCSAATERMGAKVAEINRVGTDEQIGYHCPAKYRRTVVTNATHTSAHRILIYFFFRMIRTY